MTKPKFLTKNFIENALRFALYFLAVTLTPFLAKPIAPLFDWIGYSALRPMFVEVFTMVLWGAEAGAFVLIDYLVKRRRGGTGQELPVAEGKAPLPLQNVLILTLLCGVCIFAISAVIGFKVKPFYDIGEKISGQQLFCGIAIIVRNAVKCLWITSMLKCAKAMASEVIEAQGGGQVCVWLLTGGILLLFGAVDVFTSVVSYPLGVRGVLTAICYLCFYAAFTAVYYFTEESTVKSYLLIVLIYLF